MALEPKKINPLLIVGIGVPLALALVPLFSFGAGLLYTHGDHHAPNLEFPFIMLAPFSILLLSIAFMPFAPHSVLHWWEQNKNRLLVAIGLSIPVVGYMYATFGSHDAWALIWHSLEEYISFIALLFTLYTISGGIHMQGNLEGTPKINTAFLAIGTILASVSGTTGASMVLIRPLLTTNKERKHVQHIYVFFIFLVSNIGGSLTPLGDPPLFLGFLRGVPFFWTLALIPMWAFASIILLIVFFIWDTIAHKKETKKDIDEDHTHIVPLKILGLEHVLLLAGAIALILITPSLEKAGSHGDHHMKLWWIRDGLMVSLALISLKLGDPTIRYKKNGFNFHAMGEVAALFLGIFLCMIPALSILKANGKSGNIPVKSPASFLWATGVCSGFLDNAPTYLVYVAVGNGVMAKNNEESLASEEAKPYEYPSLHEGQEAEVYPFKEEHLGLPEAFLLAISVGSVFFGALSYIGNAPNFMVKAICEGNGVQMPSFVGYLVWSVGILVPLYVVVTFVFFL
ncbi:MAG: sodium:proton antiporter [Planctomycetota bacterium]|nr:sodium:proton antiporter [Planctomycetota bacterium]